MKFVRTSLCQNVPAVNLANKSVTRDKLVSWLETVCYILNSFAISLLKNGRDLLDRAETLKVEKESFQKAR